MPSNVSQGKWSIDAQIGSSTTYSLCKMFSFVIVTPGGRSFCCCLARPVSFSLLNTLPNFMMENRFLPLKVTAKLRSRRKILGMRDTMHEVGNIHQHSSLTRWGLYNSPASYTSELYTTTKCYQTAHAIQLPLKLRHRHSCAAIFSRGAWQTNLGRVTTDESGKAVRSTECYSMQVAPPNFPERTKYLEFAW